MGSRYGGETRLPGVLKKESQTRPHLLAIYNPAKPSFQLSDNHRANVQALEGSDCNAEVRLRFQVWVLGSVWLSLTCLKSLQK